MEFLITVLAIVACILLFSFAIFIHEFGHFLAAKLLGLRVDRFSIGFGPALWKKTIGGVEYRISAIPFGGYVALPQLDPEGTDTLQGGTDKSEPLAEIPAWKRVVVAFAGPFGNIVLAVILALALSVAPGAHFGETPPVVETVKKGGSAELSGLRPGDHVLSVDGHAVSSWNDVNTGAALSGGRPVPFVVRRAGRELTLDVKAAYSEVLDSYLLDALPSCVPYVGAVQPGSPAEAAGMKAGDRIVSINGESVLGFAEVRSSIQRLGDQEITLGILRDGATIEVRLTPRLDPEVGRYLAGIVVAQVDTTSAWMPERSAVAQLKWDAGQIFRVLKGLVTPKESKAVAGALGGPVMIAQVLYRQVRHNFWDAVGFLRFVNINLAILNLLPIPVLDGGLIFFALFEIFARRKPSRKVVNGLSMVFMWFFLGLMLLLVWRDVARTRRIGQAEDQQERQHEDQGQIEQLKKDFRPAFDLNPKLEVR